MVNDNIQMRIMTGKVKTKPEVERFSEKAVTFSDGSTADIDTVIFATGYRVAPPLVDLSIIQGIFDISCCQVWITSVKKQVLHLNKTVRKDLSNVISFLKEKDC